MNFVAPSLNTLPFGGRARSIKAVFFDAGGTLLHPYPSVGDIYAREALDFGIQLSPGRIQASFYQAFRNHSNQRAGLKASEASERAFWRQVVWETHLSAGSDPRDFNFDAYLSRLYEVMARPDVWKLYPDALPCLEKLARLGMPLGIISNWDSRLIKTLQGLGLSRFFKTIRVSSLSGISKPDPLLFLMAARDLGLHPAQCLHVGDTLRDDVYGAEGAGMKGVLIDRSGFGCPGNVRSISSLLEILSFC